MHPDAISPLIVWSRMVAGLLVRPGVHILEHAGLLEGRTIRLSDIVECLGREKLKQGTMGIDSRRVLSSWIAGGTWRAYPSFGLIYKPKTTHRFSRPSYHHSNVQQSWETRDVAYP